MNRFHVPDMTCGHCARAITQALVQLDPTASTAVDIARKLVTVTSTAASPEAVAAAIRAAGYTAEPVAAPQATTTRSGGCGSGCGCGSRRATAPQPAPATASCCS